MHFPSFALESELFQAGHAVVIGCDEVGRGCLAGPVVAAAVALRWDEQAVADRKHLLALVRDSKLLSGAQRQRAISALEGVVLASAIGVVDSETIDGINIHHASLLAMRKAVNKLRRIVGRQGFVVVDGKHRVPYLRYPQRAVVDGDADVFSVAAASIIAKEHRDALMTRMDKRYPGYGFATHVGYATKYHREAIARLGLTPIHRRSFCTRVTMEPYAAEASGTREGIHDA